MAYPPVLSAIFAKPLFLQDIGLFVRKSLNLGATVPSAITVNRESLPFLDHVIDLVLTRLSFPSEQTTRILRPRS